MITIYTDGSCLNNPGKGGWAALLFFHKKDIDLEEARKIELVGNNVQTTNNRMEINAVVEALKYVVNYPKIIKSKIKIVDIFTDSQLVVNFCNTWRFRWKQQNWYDKKKKQERLNTDLWKELDILLDKAILDLDVKLTVKWVKGHSNNKWNNECDLLARAEASKL